MKIDLKLGIPANVTVVSNEFIDQYMAAANGEYVKVFLYLLRHEREEFAPDSQESEQKQEDFEPARRKLGREDSRLPETGDTYERMRRLSSDEEFSALLYAVQQYLGKTFTQIECEKFAFFYDGLHMSGELLEYLAEYCAGGGQIGRAHV